MATRILVVGDNSQSFLIKALMKSLTEASYEVMFSPPDISYIDIRRGEEDFPEIIILYLERIEDSDNRFFTYIEDFMENEGKKFRLYFIGNAGEINQAYAYIKKEYVKYAFERPVEVSELIKILQRDGGDYSFSNEAKQYKDLDPDKKTILVVDDEIVQLHAMERWLQKTYNVLTEKSGTEAIALLGCNKVDMILLDYEMPILSGLEVFQLLKADPATASIPVVFLTANDDSSIVKKVVDLHPVGYLLKNFSPVILVQRIEAIFKSLEEAKKPQRPSYYKKL